MPPARQRRRIPVREDLAVALVGEAIGLLADPLDRTHVVLLAAGTSWEAANLLSWAQIEYDERQGASIVRWRYDAVIRSRLLSPETYMRITIEMLQRASTHGGIVLAELGRRYFTSPGGLSERRPWEEWVPVITGSSERGNQEYKYFHRDVLRPAINEVNSLQQEFDIEVVTHRVNRRVRDLQFKVTPRPKPASTGLQDNPKPEMDLELIGRLLALGLRQTEAEELVVCEDVEALRAAMRYTERRKKNSSLGELRSPKSYLLKALRDSYAEPGEVSASPPGAAAGPDPFEALREQYQQRQRVDAENMFREMSEEAKRDEVQAFMDDHATVAGLRSVLRGADTESVLGEPRLKSIFLGWLTRRYWPKEPTSEQLAVWAVNAGAVKLGTKPSASERSMRPERNVTGKRRADAGSRRRLPQRLGRTKRPNADQATQGAGPRPRFFPPEPSSPAIALPTV